MELQYIPDHIEQALGNLESQFARAPNIRAVVRATVARVQELEDAAWSTLVERYLASASGAALEQYGKIVGVGRGGLSDAAYRQMIGARILGNLSSGSIDRLLDIYQILQGGRPVSVAEVYPNALIFSAEQPSPTTAEERRRTRDWMHQVKKAGVALTLIEAASVGSFGFLGAADNLGFNEGTLSGVI